MILILLQPCYDINNVLIKRKTLFATFSLYGNLTKFICNSGARR